MWCPAKCRLDAGETYMYRSRNGFGISYVYVRKSERVNVVTTILKLVALDNIPQPVFSAVLVVHSMLVCVHCHCVLVVAYPGYTVMHTSIEYNLSFMMLCTTTCLHTPPSVPTLFGYSTIIIMSMEYQAYRITKRISYF